MATGRIENAKSRRQIYGDVDLSKRTITDSISDRDHQIKRERSERNAARAERRTAGADEES